MIYSDTSADRHGWEHDSENFTPLGRFSLLGDKESTNRAGSPSTRSRHGWQRRLLASADASWNSLPEPVTIKEKEEEAARESDLYQPMADVIRNRWAQDRRLDSLLVEVTAAQGSRPTRASGPGLIFVASYQTFPYVPGRHFDVITFEVKPYAMLDVTVVYEALGHRRASTRAYALLHIGLPGQSCTSCSERNWNERSLGWHEERSIRRSRS